MAGVGKERASATRTLYGSWVLRTATATMGPLTALCMARRRRRRSRDMRTSWSSCRDRDGVDGRGRAWARDGDAGGVAVLGRRSTGPRRAWGPQLARVALEHGRVGTSSTGSQLPPLLTMLGHAGTYVTKNIRTRTDMSACIEKKKSNYSASAVEL
jgi:hypothetical protein